MNNQYGCFMPVKLNNFSYVRIPNKINFGRANSIKVNGPFFSIENENGALDSFLRALFNSTTDEAKKFVCPEFDDLLDLDAFKECFGSHVNYKYLSDGNFNSHSKNFLVKSVLFMDKKRGQESIINFYLVNQPDNFSRFKIYAIM